MILVVVGGGQSEVLQAAPVLARLAGAGEDVVVALPSSAAPLVPGLPWAHAALTLSGLGPRPPAAKVLTAAARLRRCPVDVALVGGSASSAALIVYLAGVPRRIGTVALGTRQWLTDSVPAPPGEPHCATWERLTAHLLGNLPAATGPAFDPGEAARRRAETLLLGSGIENGRPLVALVVGIGFAEPMTSTLPPAALGWEPERYAHLGNLLWGRHGAAFVLLGTATDRARVDRVLVDLAGEALDLCGVDDLRLVAAVLQRCDCLIGGDSPLLHLATAVATPAVGLFGPTDGRTRGPCGWGSRVVQALPPRDGGPRRLLQSMSRIRVDDVLAAVEAGLEEPGPAGAATLPFQRT